MRILLATVAASIVSFSVHATELKPINEYQFFACIGVMQAKYDVETGIFANNNPNIGKYFTEAEKVWGLDSVVDRSGVFADAMTEYHKLTPEGQLNLDTRCVGIIQRFNVMLNEARKKVY